MKIHFKKRKLSLAEQARIARRLSTLISAGISPVEAVRLIRKPVLIPAIKNISKGQLCSNAFRLLGIFDRSLVEMIKIGEQSGTLGDALMRAASFLESRDDLSRKITGAMIYPGFIGVATLGIAGFLIVYIFPKIIPLVTSMNIPLPLLTKILMVVSNILIHDWFYVFLIVVAVFIVGKLIWHYSLFVRQFARHCIVAIPIVGTIARGRTLVEIFRPLGLLVEHGELLPSALLSVAKSQKHEAYRNALTTSAALVTDGENFAASLLSRYLFPSLVTDFIEIGERTGGVAPACTHIAAIYEAEVEESVKRISVVIEPILMLGMGLTVGSVALSIVMPIYAITSHLTK